MNDGGRDVIADGLNLLRDQYAFLELILQVLNGNNDGDHQLLHSIYNAINHHGVHIPHTELLSALWQVQMGGDNK